MATKIRHKRSAVAGKQPLVSQLESGELAINTADGKVYLLRDDNTVQDITRRVFEGNTQLEVDDLGDSTSAAITATVNNDLKMSITDNGIFTNDDISIENANTLTFKELTGSGADGISLKSPDTLDAGYNLTLPPKVGTVGQLIATDANGNLFFQDADIFGGNVVYVSAEQGDDANDGQSAPVKTVKRACQIASGLVYNADGTTNGVRVNVKVAVGDYTEDNPLIVPDNTVIKGDGLRGCIIRPGNANRDMLRVRNACYFGEFTFRDGIDENQVPLITADYAVAFDDPFDTNITDRADYVNLPNTRPFITTSPYIQNCSILSFLGMNGAKIDGSKITSPNVGFVPQEQENPVVGAIPEQGKSMVANAFTILSFGGTAWRLTNDAYAQIVSCFEIFLLNGVYCQSGGYCSITNSATNFGLYALRSSGYSPKAFEFDRAFVTGTGAFEGLQTVSIVGINRDTPVEEFVLRFREPDYKFANETLLVERDQIAADTVTWINQQIAAASPSIWAGFTYDQAKCERDTGLLVDAIRWDAAFDTNYRSVSSALTYFNGRFPAALFAAQKAQHVEAFTQAKAFTTNVTQVSAYETRVNALWDEIIEILDNDKTFTATTGTTYDPNTGLLVINIGNHNLQIGTSVIIADNSLTFTCASDGNNTQHTYPRSTDPASEKALTISAVTADTITVNVGVSSDTSVHTWVEAVANSITIEGVGVTGLTDPTGYNTSYLTGYGDARTQLENNRNFIIKEITAWIADQVAAEISPFVSTYSYDVAQCENDIGLILDALRYDLTYGGNLQTFDAAIQYFVGTTKQLADGQKATTLAAYARLKEVIGKVILEQTVVKSGGGAHTYVGGTVSNAITITAGSVQRDVTAADYNYITGVMELTIGSHSFTTSDTVTIAANSLTFTCDLDSNSTNHTYPRVGDPAYNTAIAITAVTGTTITVNVGPAGNALTQDTSATPGTTDSANFAKDRIQEIIDYINSDGATPPTKVEPADAWVANQAFVEDKNRLYSEAQKNIGQNVNAYIETQVDAAQWYNFVYDNAKCLRDTKLIVEAVAKDAWDTGNRYSRSAGLSYYNKNIGDSSQITISGQERQTISAINQAKALTLATITNLSTSAQNFVGSRFDIVTTIINDGADLPDAQDVSSEGDITNDFKTNATESTFNAATDVNTTADVFTITGHGFTNLQKVIYDPDNNPPIQGLDAEQTYYIKIVNDDEFTLCFDESGDFAVNVIATSTGTHKFLSGVIEFFVNEITSSHTTYQKLELESGSESYEFVPGRQITGVTGASNNAAIVFSWKPAIRELIVSIEEVAVGQSLLRIQFDETSTITSDHASTPNTTIGVNAAQTQLGLGTATFAVKATDGSSALTNLANLPENQVWFHRPSIVNSSSHTWEYAGSGTDYNALPQNGGNTKAEFEQFEELPGRVYSSGTNELGDFKVGDFITAFNRTGNITFRNKVQVDELDALRLSLSDVAIEEISTSVNLGDDELGGASNARLSTQLAVRAFISNRLGGFVDKTVSTAAVPGAIVQLNTNGQLNGDLIPATRQFTNTNTNGYLSRLQQVDNIPAVDLKAGDIATENYEQVELTLSGNISAADGATISQPTAFGAIGYAKGLYGSSGNILVASIGGEWIVGDDSTGSQFQTGVGNNLFVDGVDSGVYPTNIGVSSQVVDNFFLKSSNSSQFLVLDPTDNYTFTTSTITTLERTSNVTTATTSGAHNLIVGNQISVVCDDNETFETNTTVLSTPSSTQFTYSNVDPDDVASFSVSSGFVGSVVRSADGNAQGRVTETRFGVLSGIDNANIVGGTLYTPTVGNQTYRDVALTNVTGSGSGATADITVTAGQVTDVDIKTGGITYAIGDLLSAANSNLGGTGSGFQIEVTAIEKRAYIDIIGGELFVASSSSVDFVEDNTAVQTARVINLDDIITHNFLAGSSGAGGAVDYTNFRITIPNHGFSNGDPLKYDTLGNTPIGGILNGQVVYAKFIDNNTIELYEGFSLLNKIEFASTPANNNHNLTRSTVNITDNSVVIEGHGYTTGDAIRINTLSDGSSANALPIVDGGDPIPDGSRFFVGSITTNSFTLHVLRSDALSSINDLVTNPEDLTSTGVGSAKSTQSNAQVTGQINTSSRLKKNWNTLAVTNIDAENIISGIISPSRLGGSGVPNSDSFLRGDSAYAVVVQKLKKASTTDNPITLTGSSISQEFYSTVSIGVDNVDLDPGGTFSTLGVSKFLQSQFDVNSNASGEVFIKDGIVDAGTLDGLDSAYFLNPANLTSPVPVNRGGTNITTYARGDLLYAETTGTLNPLNIGRNNAILKSNGGTPEWGTALDLAEGLDVGAAALTSGSTGSGSVYDENVTSLNIGGAATNIDIGSTDGTRNLFPFLAGYDASASQNVVANLASITGTTNDATANGLNEIPLDDTSSVLTGMVVTGSASIPANTTVSGVTTEYIYLSNNTTGTILSGQSLTFTYTPKTLGVEVGDTINIGSSTKTNLDGTWPVTGATANATSFTFQTDDNVTSNPVDAPAGQLTINANFVVRNPNMFIGNAQTSTTPVNGFIGGTSAVGIDTAGGNLTLQAGLGTGNATGGDFIVRTGESLTTSDIQHIATTRMTIDTAGKAAFTGEVEVNNNISTTEATVALLDDTVTTINMGGAATAIDIGAATGTTTIKNNLDVDGDANIDGGDITTNQTSMNVINANATTVNAFGAATTINMGTGGDGGGTTTIGHDLVVSGDLTVNGDTTTINSTELTVDDKTITVASGAADGAAANGAGLVVDGANASLLWDNANTSWDSTEDFNLASGKAYYINDASVLNSTTLGGAVVNSSLETLGTITTGVWNGTIISPTYGGTGVNNGTKTITLGGNFTHSGAHTLTLTTTNNTSVTLPTSGTLAVTGTGLQQFASTTSAQLAGVISDETGTGELVFNNNPNFTNSVTTSSTSFAAFNTNATTVNAFGAATGLSLGATTGTTTVNNALDVLGNLSIGGLSDLTVSGGTFSLANTGATTVNAFGAATTINMGASTGTMNLNNANIVLAGDLAVNGNTIDTDETGTFNLLKDNTTAIAFGQAATAIVIGETTGTSTFRHNVAIDQDLTITGNLVIGAIDDVPIGQNTPAAGGFTTLSANNFVTFTDATNATGTFAGGAAAVKITGGLHVAKDIKADNFIGDASASDLTSGTIPDARVPSSAITQHQTDITATGALNGGSITSGFGNVDIGTSTFSGNGSGLTDLSATQLTTGTIPDGRIQSSGVTQHQGDITGVGQLASGSISSGFGNIDIGTNSITATGAASLGSTNFNDNNLTNVGNIALDSLSADNGTSISVNANAIVTVLNTSSATSTTTGALRISGGIGVAGNIYGAAIYTSDGSNIQSLNASFLSSGTVPNTRIDGTYSNLTGTGALDAGEITANFGNINIGTSTFTGNGSGLTSVDADTVDGINSTSFLRSDADDTATGLITVSRSGEMLKLADSSSTGSPYIGLWQASTRRAYIQYTDTGDVLQLANEGGSTRLDIDGGVGGLKFIEGSNEYTVWHSGNDGAGSGLNADTVDGISSGSFLRSDTNDSFSGTISGTGDINISGNITAATYSGDGSGLTGVTATNASTLDNLDSTQFLRSDQSDTMDAGDNTKLTILCNDAGNAELELRGEGQGTGRLFVGQSSAYGGGIEYNGDNTPATSGGGADRIVLYRRDNGTDAWTAYNNYNDNNWEFRGEVTAYSSDARLKDVSGNIEGAVEKVKALNGVIYTWNDTAFEKGLKTSADSNSPEAGLLAQEVQKVLPEVVAPAPFDNEYLTIKYERVVPLLVEAIKEQQSQIDELKEMVAKLLDK